VTSSDAVAEYAEAALIHLTAVDPGTGVAATYYELDGGEPTVGTSISVATVGEHVLVFWSVDLSGNVEDPREARFTIAAYDQLPPDTVSQVETSYVGVATIPLTAEDDRSGVSATYYRLDGGLQVTGTQVTVSTVGAHTLEYWSVDGAGNIEAVNTATFTVSALPKPTLTRPSAPSSVVHKRSFTVSGYVKPRVAAGSIVKLYLYRYESGHWKLRKTVSAKVADYSTYSRFSVKTSLTSKGKWRVRSYFSDATHAPSYSSYRNLTIK